MHNEEVPTKSQRFSLDSMPLHVHDIAKVLHGAGFDVWLVGGALRDCFSGKAPGDWDLATSASPGQVILLFPKVIPLGIRHGTVQIVGPSGGVEVTSCAPGIQGILADLGRRDFTVNALALAYPDGLLLDPHCGLRDLRSGMLRAVGDARARFAEDPLRVVRACRFVSSDGFRIHRDTFKALREEAEGLQGVARERIREEMFKLILGGSVFRAFDRMRLGGVLELVLPEFVAATRGKRNRGRFSEGQIHILRTVESCPPRLRLRLAALFHEMNPAGTDRPGTGECDAGQSPLEERAATAAQVLSRWRASGRQIREVTALIRCRVPEGVSTWDDVAIRRFVANIDGDLLEDVLDLALAKSVSRNDNGFLLEECRWLKLKVGGLLAAGEVPRFDELAVNGRDIMGLLGLDPGPAVGQVLKRLHDKVMEDPSMNRRKILVDFLKKTEL